MWRNSHSCQAGSRSQFCALLLHGVGCHPQKENKKSNSHILVTKNISKEEITECFTVNAVEFSPSSELQVFPLHLNFVLWVFVLSIAFLSQTHIRGLGCFLSYIQSSAGDLEQEGVALIFSFIRWHTRTQNQISYVGWCYIAGILWCLQRLQALAEVCGSPGLTRGWGDMSLCTGNRATVRSWTMWKFCSGSGHFSHRHSFPSLEAVWSISFFCLFHLGTNVSFPSAPAALKGFLVSPECVMQYCRASSFFFSTPCLYHVL